MDVKKIKLYTEMRDYGQMINRITFEVPGGAPELAPGDFLLSNCCDDLSAKHPIGGISAVETAGDTVTLTTDWFLYRLAFEIKGRGAAEGIVINKTSVGEVEVLHADWFSRHAEDGVNYRLYAPKRECGPRPLVLFLHGGGGSGEDNELQLTDTLGAIKLAERCPDMYVMAPQAPTGGLTLQQAFARMQAKGDPYKVILGSDTDNEFDSRGWNRWYLAKVADIIRRMIVGGEVDRDEHGRRRDLENAVRRAGTVCRRRVYLPQHERRVLADPEPSAGCPHVPCHRIHRPLALPPCVYPPGGQ